MENDQVKTGDEEGIPMIQVLLFVFGLRFSSLPKTIFLKKKILELDFVCLEDLFKFLWVLDGIKKTVLRQLVASTLRFTFSSHLENLVMQVFILEWARVERFLNFSLCLAFCGCFVKEMLCIALFRLPSCFVA